MNKTNSSIPDSEVWDRYWADGRLAACSGDQGQHYFPIIQTLWREFFSALFNQAAVLDLATGNGAVLDLARQRAEQLDIAVQLHGVDQARIGPGSLLARSKDSGINIEMHGESRIEQLPFTESSFDFVSSQFGIEYSNLDLTVPEVARVIKPGGLLMLIVHRSDSGILSQTHRDLADYEFIEMEDDLILLFGELLDSEVQDGRLDQALKSSPPYLAAKERFDRAATRVAIRMQQRAAGTVSFLNGLMLSMGEIYQHRHQHPLATVLDRYQELQNEIQAHVRRLQQMQAAALDNPGLDSLRKRLTDNRFDLQVDEQVVDDNGHQLGHRLLVRRSDQGNP